MRFWAADSAAGSFKRSAPRLALAYAVGGGFDLPYDHPGEFRVEVLTKSATTVEATTNALEEIAGLNSRPFTEEELKRAKDDILNSFLFRYDTKDKILAERERLEFYGYPADYLETYRAALEKVTLDDVTAAAKKYIHPGKLAVLVVGNGPEIKPGLDALDLGAPKPIDITIPQPARPGSRRRGGTIAGRLESVIHFSDWRESKEQTLAPEGCNEHNRETRRKRCED